MNDKICVECNKKLSDNRSTYCKSCSKKRLRNPAYKDGRTVIKHYCKDCGRGLVLYTAKRCKKCSEKYFVKIINRHHIDLNRTNNNKNNLLYLKLSTHESLHRRAYDYLVKTAKINKYITWFISEFNPKLYTKKECYKSRS